jgi:hypothetical protein
MSTSYSPRIVTDGLVLCLDVANQRSYPGTGVNWYDLCVNGNNGTLVNGVGYSDSNGGSLVFDGADDYVAISNLGLSSHTIEGWFNSSDVLQGGAVAATICNIFGNYDGGVSKYTFIGLIPNLAFRIDDGATSFASVAQISYSANTWYHVALTYNASDGDTRAYVNGNQIGSRSSTTNIVFNSIPFNMSKSQTGTYFDGLIAVGKAYNRALTAQEVMQNYNALKGRFGL